MAKAVVANLMFLISCNENLMKPELTRATNKLLHTPINFVWTFEYWIDSKISKNENFPDIAYITEGCRPPNIVVNNQENRTPTILERVINQLIDIIILTKA